jgi:TRAP-type C4-dicarboxylate transport system permease small subunit
LSRYLSSLSSRAEWCIAVIAGAMLGVLVWAVVYTFLSTSSNAVTHDQLAQMIRLLEDICRYMSARCGLP